MKHVVIIVDNKRWCWTSSMQAVVRHIYNYKCTLVPAAIYGKTAETLKCDLVYGRGYCFDFAASVPNGTPWIYTVGTGGAALQGRILECFLDSRLDGCLGVVVQNKYTKTALMGLHDKVWLIPNGVDTDKFCPHVKPPRRQAIVGMAANITGPRAELKGVDMVRAACDNLGLELRLITQENRLEHDQVPDWLRGLSIYAQPSDSEGCSNSVMEAMSCGLPVLICRGVGYHGEACSEQEVVFVERSIESITSALRRLVSDRAYKQAISARARQFATCHRWQQIAQKYKRMFDEALQ